MCYLLLILVYSSAFAQDFFFVEAPFTDDEEFGYVPKGTLIQPTGQVNALAIFAQFADEAEKGDALPTYAQDLFDPEIPGSFAHYYRTMSFGQLAIHGTILPKRYTSLSPAAAYLAPTQDIKGNFDRFVDEILAQVDQEFDLGQFNNDGADGLPNSADDDRRVDYVFILMRSVPSRFLLGNATGIAGLKTKYRSQDKNAKGKKLYISGMRYHGTIFKAGNFLQTAGIMVHEFAHSMGLPDLYDLDYTNPQEDSAGIGRWGVMGRDGTYGWAGGGASPFCAWSREKLGWLGPDNSQRVAVNADTSDLELTDLYRGGVVYKIALPSYLEDDEEQEQYLLLEYRDPAANYYNRNQPGAGLLVWHVRPEADNNNYEELKKVDLICADGLYLDAGYPQGQQAAPEQGRDNLDFWAHDADYRDGHRGNSGDATDLFDGVRFRQLDLNSNPSTINAPGAATGGPIINIKSDGQRLSLDIVLPGLASASNELVLLVVATAIEEEFSTEQQPEDFALLPNYPNPFGPQTTIPYQLAEACPVRVEIFNSLGQRIRTLVDTYQSAGRQEIRWDGRDEEGYMAATGVYLCRLEAEGLFGQTRQMLRLPGFAQLSDLDSALRGHGRDWGELKPYLDGPAKPQFGYIHELLPTRIAFSLGRAWTQIEILQRASAELRAIVPHTEVIAEMLPPFAAAPEQQQIAKALLTQWQQEPIDAANQAELYATISTIIGGHSDEAALYFFVGQWQQRLQTAVLAAQRLAVPLSVDLLAEATTSRHLGEALRQLKAEEDLAGRFDALAATLQGGAQDPISYPNLLRQLQELVLALKAY